MKCQKCNKDFPESEIQVSHNVPIYMFEGEDRRMRKNKADKMGRTNLCKKCHDIYERLVFLVSFNQLSSQQQTICINAVFRFSERYFKRGKKDDTKTT